MTPTHTLAATIARAIFDRIERDRTLILQNIEEVVRDQLAIEGAKSSEANRRMDEVIQLAIEGAKRYGGPVAPDPTPRRRKSLPEIVAANESSKKWWIENAEGFYGDDWK